MHVDLPVDRAELLFEETVAADEVPMDLSDAVTLDPRLAAAKLTVERIRLDRTQKPDSSHHWYEFSAALLPRGRTWPDGDFRLDLYDRADRLLGRERLEVDRTVDRGRRTLSHRGSFMSVKGVVGRAELILDSPDVPDDEAGETAVVTESDPAAEDAAGLSVTSLGTDIASDAAGRPVLRLQGRVESRDGSRLSGALCVQVTAYDDAGHVVAADVVDLGSVPLPARSFSCEIAYTGQQAPARVGVELFLNG